MAPKLLLALAASLAFLPPALLRADEARNNETLRLSCSYCESGLRMESQVTFDRVFTGNYRPGEPYDIVTVAPDGSGESFADVGIRIRARFLCDRYTPGEIIRAGLAADFLLWSKDLCMCVPKAADAGPDAEGWVEWSGTLAAGGCAQELWVFIDGTYTGTIPVKTNSPDVQGTSGCYTDGSDFALMVTKLGRPERWDICFDFNESGPPAIDGSDLAYFASLLGAACP